MLPNKIIDDYIEKKIAFYKDLKSHHKEDISISDSIIINREFISALESDFTDFIKLREKSNNIPRKENESFKKALIEKFELLKVIKENNEKPSIYWFEIINNPIHRMRSFGKNLEVQKTLVQVGGQKPIMMSNSIQTFCIWEKSRKIYLEDYSNISVLHIKKHHHSN